ncbi:ATP-binding protein [Streptomyces lunaelactis]|uniref:ATP-binding protein n=1 Tax=Streptomyces lunaelactis TaxID=1535768 RepID=UPI0015855759|nr:ATP-binding protein [Streptomyces lunaelactis]NUK00366.1 ATP-binding protein [Streptomyces lunaelactis]NUK06810.1 ATP-binding protein [Streptomyces lunaelactis]NUK14174.1 ATP-binding protein [Streptomyces lunaelactis]NUK21781.1 ATP-binding protein [Streptomyces lunaelactis]NUK33422.1 ATP-binding protein [Streptomyces lunaelactis]
MAAQLKSVAHEAVDHVSPVPHSPRAVSVVRGRVRAVLAEWGLPPDVTMDAVLVASELLTNALVHALPPATLRLSWVRVDERRALRVEVTDTGRALPARQSTDPDEHGRGIAIVTALSARCGIHVHTGGITHWADLFAA